MRLSREAYEKSQTTSNVINGSSAAASSIPAAAAAAMPLAATPGAAIPLVQSSLDVPTPMELDVELTTDIQVKR